MPRVILSGWKPGLKKASLTRLLQDRAGLRLETAREYTDRCLAEQAVAIELPTLAAAESLTREASEVRALVEIIVGVPRD